MREDIVKITDYIRDQQSRKEPERRPRNELSLVKFDVDL